MRKVFKKEKKEGKEKKKGSSKRSSSDATMEPVMQSGPAARAPRGPVTQAGFREAPAEDPQRSRTFKPTRSHAPQPERLNARTGSFTLSRKPSNGSSDEQPPSPSGGAPARPIISEYSIPNLNGPPPPRAKPVISEYSVPTAKNGGEGNVDDLINWAMAWSLLSSGADQSCDMNLFLNNYARHYSLTLGDPVRRLFIEFFGMEMANEAFRQLLGLAGPLPELIDNFCALATQVWFYNYLSEADAEQWLRQFPPGTFLVRLGGWTEINRLLVEVNGQNGEIIRLNCMSVFPEQGLTVEGESGTVYPNILEVLNAHQSKLMQPMMNTWIDEPWFHGKVSTDEANELLRDEQPGAFLVRFSSQPNSFTISQLMDNSTFISVSHVRLTMSADGTLHDQRGSPWKSIHEYLDMSGLRYCKVNRISSIRNACREMCQSGAPTEPLSSSSTSVSGTSSMQGPSMSGPRFSEG